MLGFPFQHFVPRLSGSRYQTGISMQLMFSNRITAVLQTLSLLASCDSNHQKISRSKVAAWYFSSLFDGSLFPPVPLRAAANLSFICVSFPQRLLAASHSSSGKLYPFMFFRLGMEGGFSQFIYLSYDTYLLCHLPREQVQVRMFGAVAVVGAGAKTRARNLETKSYGKSVRKSGKSLCVTVMTDRRGEGCEKFLWRISR